MVTCADLAQRGVKAGGRDAETAKWMQKQKRSMAGQNVWVSGLCGLSGYPGGHTNALKKLPMSLCCHCTCLKAHSAFRAWGAGGDLDPDQVPVVLLPGCHTRSESALSFSSGLFGFHTGDETAGYCYS